MAFIAAGILVLWHAPSAPLTSWRRPSKLRRMVPEAPMDETETGRVATGDGWFVLNAKDARWYHAEGRPALCNLEGETFFPQVGINIVVLWPGQPMAMYHWEADQEDFLVLSGEALLIVEGEERPLESGTSCIVRPRRTTRSSAPVTGPVSSLRPAPHPVGRQPRLGWLHLGRGRAAPRRRRRAGDDQRARGVRERHAAAAADRLPTGLARLERSR